MAKLHITCGKVCSGKTYFAKEYSLGNNALYISVDELMLGIFGGCLGENHMETERKAVFSLLETAVGAVRAGAECVFDYGFWSRADREEVSERCEQSGIEYEWHYLDADFETRKGRLEDRNAKLLGSGTEGYIMDNEQLLKFDGWFEAYD